MFIRNFVLPKGTSLAVGNSLRQYVMSQVTAWRPIAFTLNREMNMLHSSDDIPTDLVQLMGKISDLEFLATGDLDGDYYKIRVSAQRELKVSDLKDTNFQVVGEESTLVTSLSDQAVELTIVLRKSYGGHERSQNVEFLAEQGEDEKLFSIFNSRHTDVKVCTYKTSPAGLDAEKLEFSLQSTLGNEEQIFKSGIEFFQKILTEMKQQL